MPGLRLTRSLENCRKDATTTDDGLEKKSITFPSPPVPSHAQYQAKSRRSRSSSQASLTVCEGRGSLVCLPSRPKRADDSNAHSTTKTAVLSQSIKHCPFLSPPIRLVVGGPESPSAETEPVTFYAHAHLLTSISDFFAAALKPTYSFNEGSQQQIWLPEERPEDIRFLLKYVYACASTHDEQEERSRILRNVTRKQATKLSVKADSYDKGNVEPKIDAGYHLLLDQSRRSGIRQDTLWHHKVNPPLDALSQWKCHVAKFKQVENCGDISELVGTPPSPPAFGPFIRLYLLAERLQISKCSLRDDICDRLLYVSQASSAVPGADDIYALFDTLPLSAWSRGLPKLVTDLYIGLNCRCLLGKEVDQGEVWHDGFLRQIIGALMEEHVNLSKLSVHGKASDDSDVPNGDFGDIHIGRLRRKWNAYSHDERQ